jgi:hypothetical protein
MHAHRDSTHRHCPKLATRAAHTPTNGLPPHPLPSPRLPPRAKAAEAEAEAAARQQPVPSRRSVRKTAGDAGEGVDGRVELPSRKRTVVGRGCDGVIASAADRRQGAIGVVPEASADDSAAIKYNFVRKWMDDRGVALRWDGGRLGWIGGEGRGGRRGDSKPLNHDRVVVVLVVVVVVGVVR